MSNITSVVGPAHLSPRRLNRGPAEGLEWPDNRNMGGSLSSKAVVIGQRTAASPTGPRKDTPYLEREQQEAWLRGMFDWRGDPPKAQTTFLPDGPGGPMSLPVLSELCGAWELTVLQVAGRTANFFGRRCFPISVLESKRNDVCADLQGARLRDWWRCGRLRSPPAERSQGLLQTPFQHGPLRHDKTEIWGLQRQGKPNHAADRLGTCLNHAVVT